MRVEHDHFLPVSVRVGVEVRARVRVRLRAREIRIRQQLRVSVGQLRIRGCSINLAPPENEVQKGEQAVGARHVHHQVPHLAHLGLFREQ